MTIHLIEGPVGSGKSTFAARISQAHSAPRLILDEWMVVLFRPDRPPPGDPGFVEWYNERKQRCIEQIWRVASDVMDTGADVVLELGLVAQQNRVDFYSRVDATDYPLKVYVVDAPEVVRRERVRERNEKRGATYQMEVPDEIFELANRAWQPPDDTEAEARDVVFVSTAPD